MGQQKTNNDGIRVAVTSEVVHAGKVDIWHKLGFYEHVNKKPPMVLRIVLPVPREVEGRHAEVGDLCRCRYSDGGHLTKRMTRVVDGERIEFEIVEQSIRWQNAIKLRGGYIEVDEYAPGVCAVTMLTYFETRTHAASYLCCPIKRIIKYMHRFVMEDLRTQVRPGLAGKIPGAAV